MKKCHILIIIISLLILSSLVSALSNEQNKEVRTCKKDCYINQNLDKSFIKNDYNECVKTCSGKQKQKCIFLCKDKKTFETNKLKFIYANCNKDCINKIKFPNATCLEGKYKAGDIFLQECEICRCDFNSRVYCKKTPYCNFDEIITQESICQNGLYQQLCNGPYFDIVCSKYDYCICDGTNNYACPSDYACIKNFSLSLNRRDNTVSGWKTLLGKDLGSIGICAKKPILSSCGNGVCENLIKSLNESAETSMNCPSDCK